MFGSIIAITPLVGWSLPALIPIVTAAAGYLGFVKLTQIDATGWIQGKLAKKIQFQKKNRRIVKVPLSQYIKDIVSPEVGREERLEFVKEDILLVFRKDIRGHFFIEIEGPSSFSSSELRYIADEFYKSMIQQFAYNKIVKELELRGVNIVEEEINERGEIILQTRKWD